MSIKRDIFLILFETDEVMYFNNNFYKDKELFFIMEN